ncbi:ABC transporter permease [Neobacillus notoginsengisoli]|uniref:ABC transporter permease n=1 Tax=Neobacillus notoginsengisoli TaxID=1578198 RepID=A0A417YS01_9BACI|nr:ABC transporter permease subunit [Neobacillus notoginsengisoli]RHW38077.1 ABC transporter permease [Neobacillus notoginsengisoli]
MSQWLTLFQKELLEMWRNFKWVWVPITFILLGVQEPLISYYMPQIIESVGNLPEGAVIEIPPPSEAEVLVSSMGQFNTLGVLIIILVSMSLVAGERKSGIAAMILVKPVSYAKYITAKWAGSLLLVWVAFLIGMLASWYYTGILFDWIPIGDLLGATLLEGLWLSFVLTVSVFFSSLLLVPGAAGFAGLATIIILTILSGSLGHWLEWSPAGLPGYAGGLLMAGKVPDDTVMAAVLSLAAIIVLLTVSVVAFKRKELAA